MPKKINPICMHPMFGPGTKKIDGKNIIIIPIKDAKKELATSKLLFPKANFVTIDAVEHDKKIAICQSLLLKPDGSVDSSGDFIDKLGVVYNSKTKTDEIREISSARGASMLIRRSVFEKLFFSIEKYNHFSWSIGASTYIPLSNHPWEIPPLILIGIFLISNNLYSGIDNVTCGIGRALDPTTIEPNDKGK